MFDIPIAARPMSYGEYLNRFLMLKFNLSELIEHDYTSHVIIRDHEYPPNHQGEVHAAVVDCVMRHLLVEPLADGMAHQEFYPNLLRPTLEQAQAYSDKMYKEQSEELQQSQYYPYSRYIDVEMFGNGEGTPLIKKITDLCDQELQHSNSQAIAMALRNKYLRYNRNWLQASIPENMLETVKTYWDKAYDASDTLDVYTPKIDSCADALVSEFKVSPFVGKLVATNYRNLLKIPKIEQDYEDFKLPESFTEKALLLINASIDAIEQKAAAVKERNKGITIRKLTAEEVRIIYEAACAHDDAFAARFGHSVAAAGVDILSYPAALVVSSDEILQSLCGDALPDYIYAMKQSMAR
jgi:hypothetical protein